MHELIVEEICPVGDISFVPKYATEGSSGLDLLSSASLVISPGKLSMIPTGIRVRLPPNCEAQIRPRSGFASKHGVTVLNSPGTIDNDYRGEICVLLINHGEKDFVVERGMRIAQMVICKYEKVAVKVSKVDKTKRGDSGFGSTGH